MNILDLLYLYVENMPGYIEKIQSDKK